MDKSKIGFLLIFLILLALVLLVGGTMPYFLFYTFILIFLVPLFHILINLIGLKGSVIVPNKSLFSGEIIDIDYRVTNNSILPITYLEIESNISKELTGVDSPKQIISLNKNKTFANKETLLLKRRGFYEFGEIEVTIRDIFGIFQFKKKITSKSSLIIYPETINLSTFQIAASHQLGELIIQDSSFQDKNRVANLREYKEGDRIQSIHWKLSAKADIPIIKEFENRGDTYVSVIIDNEFRYFKNDIDRRLEDKAAEVAVSIINYCLNHNIKVELRTEINKKYIELQGEQNSDFKPFLEALARFKGDGSLDFRSLLMPNFQKIKKGSTLVIITTNLDKTMGAQGIDLRMKNLNPLFIALTDINKKTGFIDQMIEKRLKQNGIPLYVLDYRTSIKESLEVYYG